MGKTTDRSKNYRNKQRNRKSNPKDYKTQEKEGVRNTCYSNDPSWYAADQAILRDAASIPFSWATGTKVPLGGTDGEYDYYVPGVCTLRLRRSLS